MKRKLFIGSSSEGLDIAKQLKSSVDFKCIEWIESEIWKEGNVFSLNSNTLHCLVKASRKFDYGILIATKDDIVKSRGSRKPAPRDNVMLEMGMFIGSLGLTRAFLLVEEETKLPSDYSGVTVTHFQKETGGSLEKSIKEIIKVFNATRYSYNLKPVPAAALAMGYFDNFLQPLAKKRQEQNISFNVQILLPKHLGDIRTEITAYKNLHESKEISIFGEGRPFINEFVMNPNNYWDIPTTLSTLDKLIDILLPSDEIGINQEKQDWKDHELRNFKGTLEVLVSKCVACRDRVTVSYLN